MRPLALKTLLDSVISQTRVPDEIIIVDGSLNSDTQECLREKEYALNIKNYLVSEEHRGLTRQRNFGVSNVSSEIDLISFLDDDIVLDPLYFERITTTFQVKADAIGVGGIDLKENTYFEFEEGNCYSKFSFYQLDGWVIKEPLRYKARKIFGLMTDLQPGIIPGYSHGRSSFPPNGVIYGVEHFMGGIATYRKNLFDHVSFSVYFEGYGLYEDFDFCVRSLPFGKLYVNTNAHVWHFHEPSGRPNTYKYGKMVIRNGWYVWKQRFPKNSIDAKLKWHATAFLLALIRLLNSVTGPSRLDALKEFVGRLAGWFSLWFNKPKIQ